MIKIGVLNIQGDVSEHFNMLRKLPRSYGVKPVNVKTADEMDGLNGLIIPGGESTVIYSFLKMAEIYDKIISMADSGMHIMGTCAGAILLSSDTGDDRVKGMGIINMKIRRNAYGRQINSFIQNIEIKQIGEFNAVFIRAPEIEEYSGAESLSDLGGSSIFVQNRKAIAMTFHPELTGNPAIHEYFARSIQNNNEA
ncbi:MAG: pyridoxal 5'-phosphate synthase glutaminase subunit PdxT [Ferroplasma sp.]